jgi:phosphomannomutase
MAENSNDFLITPVLLREYDIRGTYTKNLSDADAYAVGLRFGTYLKNSGGKYVIVGYDGRLSTPAMLGNLQKGLTETGLDVINIGIGPTPKTYFALQMIHADAAIMITGSHNPKDDNGFKISLKSGPFFGTNIKMLNDIHIVKAKTPGRISHIDMDEVYINRVVEGFSPHNKKLKVVFDPGNGAASHIIQKICAKLDIETIIINDTIDGNFPSHHPDPTIPENMEQLIDAVREHNADLGVAFDGDADRIGAVDTKGRILYGDQLMVLYAKDILSRHPGAAIIADVKSSQYLFDEVARLGGRAIMSPTGHSIVKSKMKETNAKLAGEVSGHIFIADDYYGYDDAIFSSMRLLNILANGTQSLDQLFDEFPKIYTTPEMRIDIDEDKKFPLIQKVVAKLQSENADFIDIDGARVKRPNGWWLVRASNTQAAIIARAESSTEKGMLELKEEIHAYLNCH